MRIIDLEAEINEDVIRLVDTKKDIIHKSKSVDSVEYQTLLELRYLNYMTWEQIAVEMNYELRWLYRVHSRALDAISATSH